ncbi:hypothetical protein C8R46DRAFT_1008919 [Mycena filopes]|nr:hypothetical protein C8R46DRAFT_1008919 [Mycena filopes]
MAPTVWNTVLDRNFAPLSKLKDKEIYWRDLQPWLEERGYMLRPRYRPGWVPSWKDTGEYPLLKEDFWSSGPDQIMDAIRISDGMNVILKRVKTEEHPREVEIANFLCSEGLRGDPQNHCLPVLDVLESPTPGVNLLVMKLLRRYEDPQFDTFGVALDFLRQIFEGVQFMHKNLVAHRDCCSSNIMMDGDSLYPDGFHPVFQKQKPNFTERAKPLTRTRAPPKYYLVDFGISVRFEPSAEPYTANPIIGGDKTAPELQGYGGAVPLDPFPTDVYYLGKLIRTDYPLHAGRYGFQFLRPLVNDMVNPNPAERPTMDEVVIRFEEIVGGLSAWKLRSWVRGRDKYLVLSLPQLVRHWSRRIRYIIGRVPAIPRA